MAPDPSHLVKPPQSRGHGTSAIHLEPAERWNGGTGRVYVKRQEDYCCRPLWRAFRKTPTLRRELRGLRACQRLAIAVPRIVTYREHGRRAELVLEEVRDALSLDQALATPDADEAAIVANVAAVIARLHRAGWAHGALYPEHVLVGPAPAYEVALIDLEKARRSRFRRRTDLRRFLRHAAACLDDGELATFRHHYARALKDRSVNGVA